MVEMIICEKPKAAQKIASALSAKPEKKSEKGVPYYILTRGGEKIIVAATVGHIYGLSENKKEGKKWTYPSFDVVWTPSHETSKAGDYTKKYLTLIKKLCKEADSFTVACDYDVEGETIGYNIIRFACKQKDAARMKFSTLTTPDIVNAYEKKSKTIDWGMAKSGITRHELDWYYGINTSRALTTAVKKAGIWKILSAGRVQGPALKIIVDREKERQKFKAEPYWMIELISEMKKQDVSAWHVDDRIFKRERAEEIMQNVEGKKAFVNEVERREYNQAPPTPFDLTTLQTECYRVFRISPKETLSIAQDLYTDGLISYPRTSSQQLPPSIGYSAIMKQLSSQESYEELVKKLASKKLSPNNGKKTDPAHPAIYPTGQKPKSIKDRKAKVYDIIVRRFLATFAEEAVRESMQVKIEVNKEIFIAKGARTKTPGWHEFYKYINIKEEMLPDVKKGEEVKVKDIVMHDKETQPPKRYTQSSIIKELEGRALGTKSTRANIIDTLYQRNYVINDPIEATDLGISIIETLELYIPEIVDEELTRHFEKEMEEIYEGKKEPDQVCEEAKEFLTKVLAKFKKKEKEVGEALEKATKETRAELTTVGKCDKCEGDLIMRKGRFGPFVACNKYPECKNTFTLPKGLVKPSKNTCQECGMPTVLVIRKGKQPQELCINKDCKTKKVDTSKFKEKPCPKCKEGTVVIKDSFYGAFAACNKYPNCKYTEKIEEKNKSADKNRAIEKN